MASSSSSTNPTNPRHMYCHCGERMCMFTSWTLKNPGRRFVRCPKVKSRYCTTFSFIDEELSHYYKELVYDLHSRSKQTGNTNLGDEDVESKLQLLKALEDLNIPISNQRLSLKDKALYFFAGFSVMLSIVIALVVIH